MKKSPFSLSAVVSMRCSAREKLQMRLAASRAGLDLGAFLRNRLAAAETPCLATQPGAASSTTPACLLPAGHDGVPHWWRDPVTGEAHVWWSRAEQGGTWQTSGGLLDRRSA